MKDDKVQHRDTGQFPVKVNGKHVLMMSASGHRDAAELLQQLYVGLCNKLQVDPFPPVMDLDIMLTYMGPSFFSGEDLTTLMETDFLRGFMLGRLVSFIEADATEAMNEEDPE